MIQTPSPRKFPHAVPFAWKTLYILAFHFKTLSSERPLSEVSYQILCHYSLSHSLSLLVKVIATGLNDWEESGELAQCLKAQAVFVEELGVVLRTPMVAQTTHNSSY